MNAILPVILLLVSGASCRYLQCPKANGKFAIENSDCKSYYKCENWKVENEKTCPDGQNFNPSLQRCDYEELYYCAEKEIKKYKICKKNSGKFPKENSHCRGYYECDKWKVTGEFTCPLGENFNPEQQWCDWEELYPCLEDKSHSKCPKPNGFFPKLESECKSYYECVNGKIYELQCPDDLIFDPVQEQCEWPELYSCDEKGVETTVKTSPVTYISSTTSPTEETSTTESKETNHTTDSTERTKSTAETMTSLTTNSIPTKFPQSTATESTVKTSSTTDQSSTYTGTEWTDIYTRTSIASTRTEGTSRTNGDYTTAPSEETSSRIATKQTSTLSSEGTSCVTETSQTQTGRIISSEQTNAVTDSFSTVGIRTDRPGDLVCPGPNGLFPHPTDETKFLSCDNDVPTEMNCPDDLIFDPRHKFCNWRRRNRL